MRTLTVVFVLILAIFSACQQPPVPGLSDADRQAIRQTSEQVIKIANETANWDEYTKLYYADNAIVNPPNTAAIKGHEAIISWLKTFPAMTDFKTEQVEVNGAGGIAYVYGTYAMTITLPKGKPTADKGKYLEVWKKQIDGSWKVAIDIFNSDL